MACEDCAKMKRELEAMQWGLDVLVGRYCEATGADPTEFGLEVRGQITGFLGALDTIAQERSITDG